MLNRSGPGFALAACACIGVIGCLASCTACRPVSGDGAGALAGVGVGDPVRIRLADGRIVHDKFILVTETRLTCRFHEFDLSDVDCIERPLSQSAVAFGSIVFGAVGMILLLGGLWYVSGGPWH